MNNPVSSTNSKYCRKCETERPTADFGREHKSADGLSNRCRSCRNKAARAAYAANPEPYRAAFKKYEDRNRELIHERRRNRRREHPDIERARYAERVSDPAKREAYNEYHRRYRAENRERINAISRASHERRKSTHPERIAAKRRRRYEREVAAGTVSEVLKLAVLERYGGLCYLCDGTATEFDHVQPITSDGVTSLENLRPVCKPCNVRKASTWPIDLDELRARIRAERSR